ncbi:hypothetical protein V502_03532 [Pseudogymnoascus sp. VKM F-4520 (FW-2644)]|nr:hypothetical protein V502_03532 [Pseudogymnoascus sp. VKM F-4520 (FW-2644)]
MTLILEYAYSGWLGPTLACASLTEIRPGLRNVKSGDGVISIHALVKSDAFAVQFIFQSAESRPSPTMTIPSPVQRLVSYHSCVDCRRRKVKCDSEEPCANCRMSSLVCRYTARRQKRGPRVSRNIAPVAQRPSGELGQNPDLSRHDVLHNHIPAEVHRLRGSPAAFESDRGPGHDREPGQDDFDSAVSLHSPTSIVWASVVDNSFASVETSRDDLLLSIRSVLPSIPLVDIVNDCISLFMQYTFPTSPIIHEATVRANASLYFSDPSCTGGYSSHEVHQRVDHMRAFTLVTALCASVASVMPESLLSYGQIVAIPFFRVSRQMLKSYEDYDLEYPNSSDDPIESQLLRLTFWHLYLSDKASACLKTRPMVFHQPSYKGSLNLQPSGEPFIPLLDSSKSSYRNSFEERLLVGFHMVASLWSSAASLVVGMGTYEATEDDRQPFVNRLTSLYYDFIAIMDGLPPWLKISSLIATPEEDSVEAFQKTSFWVQRCTLAMTFHCLRLDILQECIEKGFLEIIGLDDQPLRVAMKKAEWIQDFIETMEDVPFIYHQIKGEPSVERIRFVGTILLEMIQNINNEAIKARVDSYFRRLLDTLAKLNSKASEELKW